MAPVLGYWDIRGLAQPTRLLLAYTETEFTEKRYTIAPNLTEKFHQSDWTKDKDTLGLELPNLPYYIDGNIKITQSLAIIRHLARKNKLIGKTPEEENRVNITEQQLKESYSKYTKVVYDSNFKALKVIYMKELPQRLELLSKFLDYRPYFAGERLTYADFLAYEYLYNQKLFAPHLFYEFKNLVQFVERFESLPTISSYMKSDQYIRWPLNADYAHFGSRLHQMP